MSHRLGECIHLPLVCGSQCDSNAYFARKCSVCVFTLESSRQHNTATISSRACMFDEHKFTHTIHQHTRIRIAWRPSYASFETSTQADDDDANTVPQQQRVTMEQQTQCYSITSPSPFRRLCRAIPNDDCCWHTREMITSSHILENRESCVSFSFFGVCMPFYTNAGFKGKRVVRQNELLFIFGDVRMWFRFGGCTTMHRSMVSRSISRCVCHQIAAH